MTNMKKMIYFLGVFIVLLILIQAIVKAILTSMISDKYIGNLLTLVISVGLSFFVARKITKRSTHKKLF
ncbi:hypothetical protein D3C86_1674240 [compost metagenome]